MCYISGYGGGDRTQPFLTQDASLPFSNAKYYIRWKGDGTLTQGKIWDTSAWVDDTRFGVTGKLPATEFKRSGNFISFRVAKSMLNTDFTKLRMILCIVREDQNKTFCGTPSTVFTDGTDPSYSTYLEFNLNSGKVPVEGRVLP
jgi:hypothetical protein